MIIFVKLFDIFFYGILAIFFIYENEVVAMPYFIKTNDCASALDAVYISKKIRVYYSTDSNYMTYQIDKNANSIPDYVENIAIQANATIDVFSYLGLINPLESPRYKDVAKFIDIHLIDIKSNGIAYEMPIYWINAKNKDNQKALLIVVKNSLENFPGNYWTTVTHELFHLYQYGYNQFKDGWYLEGMTNWAERSLRAGAVGRNGEQQLPQTQDELDKLYNTSYNNLWHRLAILSDKTDGSMRLPRSLLNRTYTDGSKVFKDDKLRGHKFMRRFLENLAKASNDLSLQKNRNPHYWPEKDQRSELNRPIILKVIQQTMNEFGMNQTREEQNFLKLS